MTEDEEDIDDYMDKHFIRVSKYKIKKFHGIVDILMNRRNGLTYSKRIHDMNGIINTFTKEINRQQEILLELQNRVLERQKKESAT